MNQLSHVLTNSGSLTACLHIHTHTDRDRDRDRERDKDRERGHLTFSLSHTHTHTQDPHFLCSSLLKLSVMTLHSSPAPSPSTPITNPVRDAARGSISSPRLREKAWVVSKTCFTKQLPRS